MVTDHTNPKLRLHLTTEQTPPDSPLVPDFPLPGEAQFQGPPAMPSALLRLQLCLSAPVVDLQDTTNIIKSDIGLAVQVLRLAARKTEPSPGKIPPVSEIAIQFGTGSLGALAAHTKPLPEHLRSRAGLSACERFWTHSRLTALVAVELAEQTSDVNPEEAYLAGLLCHLGELPSLLRWTKAGSDPKDPRQIGYDMAKAWELPGVLADVIGAYGEVGPTPESRALLEIAEASDNWARQLEYLAVRDAMRSK
ncbi:MAG: HDOD domain-containing protein [Terriglobales bacterium]